MSGRILIIQLAKLGDFIQSTPLLANLRRAFPRAALEVAADQPAVLEAAGLSDLVDDVRPVGETFSAPAGPYEAVFVLNSHERAAALANLVSAENHYGPRLFQERLQFTPAQNFLMAVMAARRAAGRFNLADVWASLAPEARPEPLHWPARREAAPGPEGAPRNFRVGLQLGSRNHLRRWPVEHFSRLVTDLAGQGLAITPVLLGSAGERALGARFQKLMAGRLPVINLMGATDLTRLGREAAGLDLLVSADTGVMHLAAAVGAPVLALFFGPAHGPETGPYGPGHLIYQAAAPCAPCREGAGCRRRQCLEMPAPDLAARLAASMLLAGADPVSRAWPPGHRVWRTAADAFGQFLHPLGRPVLTAEELTALILTEAGRGVIRPDYRPEAHDPARLLGGYQRPETPLNIEADFFKTLAAQGFPGRAAEAARFLETVNRLAEALGPEIASLSSRQ